MQPNRVIDYARAAQANLELDYLRGVVICHSIIYYGIQIDKFGQGHKKAFANAKQNTALFYSANATLRYINRIIYFFILV